LILVKPTTTDTRANMDLIGTISSSLGVSPESAQGAVGSLLALVKQHAPADAFSAVETQAPETKQWMNSAAQPTVEGGGAGGGLLGDLLGAAGGALGGLGGLGAQLGAAAGPLGSLISALSKHGLSGDALGTLVPLVLQFLQTKIGPDTLARLISAVPFLAHLAGGGAQPAGEPSLAGALGSLFK
jgi:hypothetical protein